MNKRIILTIALSFLAVNLISASAVKPSLPSSEENLDANALFKRERKRRMVSERERRKTTREPLTAKVK